MRGGFDARLCASSREYEYLLPLSALGGASEVQTRARVLELDRALSTFQACNPSCPPARHATRAPHLPGLHPCVREAARPPAPLHQGSHRFHNFASGLRSAASDKHVYEAGGESWPLGLVADDEKTSPTLTLTS